MQRHPAILAPVGRIRTSRLPARYCARNGQLVPAHRVQVSVRGTVDADDRQRRSAMFDIPRGSVMRSWTGWIRPEDRAAYTGYLERTGLTDYRATPGNLGAVAVLRDLPDGRCEVRTISFWRTRADIVAFAGDDIDLAVFYPADDGFLIDRELTVAHFDVA
jgi:hypothetical protein